MNHEVLASGRYQVHRRLATGGMGEVLLAEFGGDADVSPGLLVVKRILSAAPGLAAADAQVRMLLEEGRLGLRLNHENLVETFRIDQDASSPLLVIELLAGRSMAQVLSQAKKRQEPVPVDVALAILRGACCGLHFAHTLKGPDGSSLGLVHRDVSPANIFVTFDGKVKVIDFGVAKSDDSEVKTATGILKGKLGYMSPEQSIGTSKLTPQADVWSVGVFFWEMLLAERLFSSANPTATLLQISQKAITNPRELRPELSPAVNNIAMGMLTRLADNRFASCADVVRAIDAVADFQANRVDVGGWLAGRFPDEAVAGAADAARCARRRGNLVVARGLQDGNAGSDPADYDDAATMVLPASIRAQLLSSTSQPLAHEPDDAATVRVTADMVAQLRARAGATPAIDSTAASPGEDDVATRVLSADVVRSVRTQSQSQGDAAQPATASQVPVTPAPPPAFQPPPPAPAPARPPAPAPARPPAPPPAFQPPPPAPSPSPGGRRAGMLVTPVAAAATPSSATAPPSSPTLTTQPWSSSSSSSSSLWLVIAVCTFGALVVLMGIAGSYRVPVPAPRIFVSYLDPAGFSVIVADVSHVPVGRASEPFDIANGKLLKAGDLHEAAVPSAAVEQRLKASGVWTRASLPATSKAKTQVLLPLVIVAIGLLALALSVPCVVLPAGRRRLVLQVGLFVVACVVVIGILQVGGLAWPGLGAWSAVPRLEWR